MQSGWLLINLLGLFPKAVTSRTTSFFMLQSGTMIVQMMLFCFLNMLGLILAITSECPKCLVRVVLFVCF